MIHQEQLVEEAPMVLKFDINEALEYHLNQSNKELLKGWDIRIENLDYGVVVTIGCKKLAFSSAEEATTEVQAWMTDPKSALKKWFKNLYE